MYGHVFLLKLLFSVSKSCYRKIDFGRLPWSIAPFSPFCRLLSPLSPVLAPDPLPVPLGCLGGHGVLGSQLTLISLWHFLCMSSLQVLQRNPWRPRPQIRSWQKAQNALCLRKVMQIIHTKFIYIIKAKSCISNWNHSYPVKTFGLKYVAIDLVHFPPSSSTTTIDAS